MAITTINFNNMTNIDHGIICGLGGMVISIVLVCTLSVFANGEYLEGFTGIKTGIGYSTLSTTIFIIIISLTCKPYKKVNEDDNDRRRRYLNYYLLLVIFTIALLLPLIFECIMIIVYFPKMLGHKQTGTGKFLAIYRCSIVLHMMIIIFLISKLWHKMLFGEIGNDNTIIICYESDQALQHDHILPISEVTSENIV